MKTLAKLFEVNCVMKFFLILLLLTTVEHISAQDTENKIKRPAQLTLISPLGTNGLQSHKVSNNVSINMFAGYSGGVRGAEIGGFANLTKGNVRGVQIAGFANIVNGSTKGVQLAGFVNLNKGATVGAQIAGFSNIITKEGNAAQISGFTNYTNGDAANSQIAGFANVATGKLIGVQISGFSNHIRGSLVGAQIGVVNYSKKVKGLQLGVVNVADTIEKGVAVGVLSFVKDGYRAIEIGGNETIQGVVSFKTGTRRFYNILSIGGNVMDKNAWILGYGVGSLMSVSPKLDLSVEAMAYHINEGEKTWTDELNILNKLSFSAAYDFGSNLAIFGGASWNVAVSELRNSEGVLVGSSLVPWDSYNRNESEVNIKMYPGFNVGVRMKI